MNEMKNNIKLSPRLDLLWKQSYLEEGYKVSNIPTNNSQPSICLYPRSYVKAIENIGFDKMYEFNFRGALYIDKKTLSNRIWILSFAIKFFKANSFFQVTDKKAQDKKLFFFNRHRSLGEFDHTFTKNGFVPKEQPVHKRSHFDKDYFSVLCKSQFTLCPAGDAPWSMRFYEAILSKSIPILENHQHSGRNELEYQIGYNFYTCNNSSFIYRPEWAEENYEKFIRFQTLIK
jgi:hypothetical protein